MGLGGNWFIQKTRSKKSRDTVPWRSRYGAKTKSRSRRNRSLSKVGTGTVKNSYGSANLNLLMSKFKKTTLRSDLQPGNTAVQRQIWSRVHICGLMGPTTRSEQKVRDYERWKAPHFAEINVFLPDHLQRWMFISRTTFRDDIYLPDHLQRWTFIYRTTFRDERLSPGPPSEMNVYLPDHLQRWTFISRTTFRDERLSPGPPSEMNV
jgi:hypothetical protein